MGFLCSRGGLLIERRNGLDGWNWRLGVLKKREWEISSYKYLQRGGNKKTTRELNKFHRMNKKRHRSYDSSKKKGLTHTRICESLFKKKSGGFVK